MLLHHFVVEIVCHVYTENSMNLDHELIHPDITSVNTAHNTHSFALVAKDGRGQQAFAFAKFQDG